MLLIAALRARQSAASASLRLVGYLTAGWSIVVSRKGGCCSQLLKATFMELVNCCSLIIALMLSFCKMVTDNWEGTDGPRPYLKPEGMVFFLDSARCARFSNFITINFLLCVFVDLFQLSIDYF
jgi:hypothetical protein